MSWFRKKRKPAVVEYTAVPMTIEIWAMMNSIEKAYHQSCMAGHNLDPAEPILVFRDSNGDTIMVYLAIRPATTGE